MRTRKDRSLHQRGLVKLEGARERTVEILLDRDLDLPEQQSRLPPKPAVLLTAAVAQALAALLTVAKALDTQKTMVNKYRLKETQL